MKKCILLLTILFSLNSALAISPDFEKIFSEIKAAHTSVESIKVREKYLKQMRNLKDFDRLTDTEELEDGEEYFDHYLKALTDFIIKHVGRFMLDRQSDEEQDIFARRIVGKTVGQKAKLALLKKGLVYVDDCEDFKSYIRMSKAPSSFSINYQLNYCSTGNSQGGFSNTFELISNLTLEAGEYKILYLPATMFVSKLYISVEGIRSDAYFDVMVNGDIKGTIYAPENDPLYIINIADTTNTINLRSMIGDARIQSIKVEYK
jgi:hypothetical protein